MLTWNDLTPAQKVALRNPCLLEIETLHPRYHRFIGLGTVTVTVNTGYE